jgi:3-dehydroquinate synthetase
LAHAIERITNYRKYTHGEAVYLGMKFAVALSAKRNYIKEETKCKMTTLLDKYVIVKKFPKFNIKQLTTLMRADKKVENGKINFVLSTDYDTVWCFNDITDDEIKDVYTHLIK